MRNVWERNRFMNQTKEKKGLNISTKSFLTAIVVIFILMILTYGLTFVVPEGEISFWKWAFSPVLVLGSEDNVSLIAVLIFLLVIGGIFNCLEKCGLMKYMLDKITHRFGQKRYTLLALVTFFFMAMGALIGSFEECVPLVPIVVALAIRLGWDAMTGLGMSLLAIGCGFSSGVCNPFTVGVAQEIARLPMFSGMWFRIVAFILVYILLLTFLVWYAKRVEKPIEKGMEDFHFTNNKEMNRALIFFAALLGLGMATVLSSAIITALQSYTMIIVAVTFLVAGITSCILSKSGQKLFPLFCYGMGSVLPAVLMILMANSIKYTMEEGKILEPLRSGAIGIAETLPKWAVILFIYLIVLAFNFFIASGSAKAYILMPFIVPVVVNFGISKQLCVLAFAFGDGFSNVFYPTNPVLLISLGLADVSYPKWAKWSWKFQILNLLLTSGLLLLGLAIGY